MVGAISFGAAYRVKMEVGNAARAGAAYASAHGFRQLGITAAAQNATALSTSVGVAAAQATSSCVDPTTGTITGAGGANKTCSGTGSAPGTYVTVTTQLPYELILVPPGMTPSITLTGVAVARLQ